MNSYIAHLHNQYRVVAQQSTSGAVANRLDRIASELVPEVLSEAFGNAIGNDQGVYIFSHIRSKLALAINQETSDLQIARGWAGQLTSSTVQTLTHSGREGRDWVRFDSQAEYIAQFINDTLKQRARSCWFYFPLDAYQANDPATAIRQVLLGHQEYLPEILSTLHHDGVLEAVLAELDEDSTATLWMHNLDRKQESLWPLFIQMLQFVDSFDLWQSTPSDSTDLLFNRYLATNPANADWQDRRGLARVVLEMLRFLADGYYLNLSRLNEVTIRQRVADLGSDWDWMDMDWLVQTIPKFLVLSADEKPKTDLPLRPSGLGPSPHQKTLLDDLLSALARETVHLDQQQPDSPANALRLYSLLIAYAPQWADQILGKDIIQRLLQAWAWLLKCNQPDRILKSRQNRDIANTVKALPPDEQPRATKALGELKDLGPTAIAILQKIHATEAQPGWISSPLAAVTSIETTCAGLFLLLRSVLDAKSSQIVRQSNILTNGEISPLAAMLVALGLRWAGGAGMQEGQIDAGISVLAGLDEAPRWNALQAQWAALTSADHRRFQTGLTKILAGQRLFQSGSIFIYQADLPKIGPALVAGDDSGKLWLFGGVQFSGQVMPTVQAWRDDWHAATGVAPTIVAVEPILTALGDMPDIELPTDNNYHQGQEALLAAFDELSPGQLDLQEADLTVGLIAISLMRLWARWLRQFADSSISYLSANLIAHAGHLLIDDNAIVVEMEPKPLDMVLEMAGYLDEIEHIPWFENRRVCFRRQEIP